MKLIKAASMGTLTMETRAMSQWNQELLAESLFGVTKF